MEIFNFRKTAILIGFFYFLILASLSCNKNSSNSKEICILSAAIFNSQNERDRADFELGKISEETYNTSVARRNNFAIGICAIQNLDY